MLAGLGETRTRVQFQIAGGGGGEADLSRLSNCACRSPECAYQRFRSNARQTSINSIAKTLILLRSSEQVSHQFAEARTTRGKMNHPLDQRSAHPIAGVKSVGDAGRALEFGQKVVAHEF